MGNKPYLLHHSPLPRLGGSRHAPLSDKFFVSHAGPCEVILLYFRVDSPDHPAV
jgi:hypothetical protein